MAINAVNGTAVDDASTILGISGLSAVLGQTLEAGGGGGWTPDANLATLERWIDTSQFTGFSDNDAIATAADSSGNSNELTQATSGLRPVYKTNIANGLPAMLFEGGSAHRLSGDVIPCSAATWWCVFQVDSTAAGFEIVGSGPGNSYYRFEGDGNGYFGAFRGTRINTYPTGVPTTGVVIMTGVSTASTYQIYFNGTGQGAQSADFDQGSAFELGSDSGGGKNFDGYIFEYGQCSGDESAELTDLHAYLAAKWQ